MDVRNALPTAILVGTAGVLLLPLVLAARMFNHPNSTVEPGAPQTGRQNAATTFNGTRALEYLVEQCDLGPRVSGTEANSKLQARLTEHFKSHGAQVESQAFTAPHPISEKPVVMANIVGRWNLNRKNRIVIAAHFDTRPAADEETSAARKAKTFIGANDGASGVAALMELAHHLNTLQTSVGVDLVAFDAEELVFRPSLRGNDLGEYFLGSSIFAQRYKERTTDDRYVAGVVLDMVAARNLQLHPDHTSFAEQPDLVHEIWAVAKRLRATGFKQPPRPKHDVRDDHLPLLAVGIPTIDLIDFDYVHWHRITDTAENCSATSLTQVGNVLIEWLKTK